MKYLQALVILFSAMLTTVWCLYGCGSSSSGSFEQPRVDLKAGEDGIISSLRQGRLEEAALKDNQKPLRVMFHATDRVTGESVWPVLEIGSYYPSEKFEGIWFRVEGSNRYVIVKPKTSLDLVRGKLPLEFFNSSGKIHEEEVDLSNQPALSSRATADDIAAWLIKVGAIAIGAALIALLPLGVFGVALAVTVVVARAIGLLVWTILQLGLIAVAAGIIVLIVDFISGGTLSLESLKSWISNLWGNIADFFEDLTPVREGKVNNVKRNVRLPKARAV